MRKLILFLSLTLGVLASSEAQNNQQEVIYGTVLADGYQKITKGAFWSKRPEAKTVYFGGFPDGVTVYVLTEDYFARFVKNEHNAFDINYIVIPKGERVYMKNERYYVAACGNQLEYFAPVERVQIVEKPADKLIYKEKEEPLKYELPLQNVNFEKPITKIDLGLEKKDPPKIKKKKWWIVALGVLAAAAIGFLLLKKKTPSGGPGGAPPTLPESGGPGGVPPTTGG